MDINTEGRSAHNARRGALRAVILAAIAAVTVALIPQSASALPPDGPAADYPGSWSRVWPSEVEPGERLYFEVGGYPANETVYIKIDDGMMCSDTSHGACVYHTQALNADGYATGSIIVPNIAQGQHWLRMLATGDVFDARTGEKIGYQGYSRRGGNDFTVKPISPTGANAGSGALNSDGSIAGGSVSIDLGELNPSESPSPEPSSDFSMDDVTVNITEEELPPVTEEPAQPVAAPESTSSGLPVVGVSVLVAAVLIAAGVVVWALRAKKGSAAGGSSTEQ